LRVLKRKFVPKREEVAGGGRRMHNEELRNLYISPNIIRAIKSRRLKWSGHVARMGEIKNAYRILVGNSEGKKTLETPRPRYDNIRMDLRETGW